MFGSGFAANGGSRRVVREALTVPVVLGVVIFRVVSFGLSDEPVAVTRRTEAEAAILIC